MLRTFSVYFDYVWTKYTAATRASLLPQKSSRIAGFLLIDTIYMFDIPLTIRYTYHSANHTDVLSQR